MICLGNRINCDQQLLIHFNGPAYDLPLDIFFLNQLVRAFHFMFYIKEQLESQINIFFFRFHVYSISVTK